MANWLKADAQESDIAVSTRARLARNVAGVAFPHKIRGNTIVAEKIYAPVRESFLHGKTDFSLVPLNELSALEKTRLVEQHIISKELVAIEDTAVLLSPDEAVSIMLMEEDHYRLQAIKSGFDPKGAYMACRDLAKMLGENVHYAFDTRLGYLTACPTNVGSGLRVSVMLHLKGLALSGTVQRVLSALGNAGVTARGIYGEGSAASADMYQISNQVTLGIKEEDIVENLYAVVKGLMEKEREVRRILYKNNQLEIEDRVMRAYALLQHARKLSTQEAMDHLSMISLGSSLEIIAPVSQAEIYNLMMDIMPAMLGGQGQSEAERDKARADLIQKTIF